MSTFTDTQSTIHADRDRAYTERPFRERPRSERPRGDRERAHRNMAVRAFALGAVIAGLAVGGAWLATGEHTSTPPGRRGERARDRGLAIERNDLVL